MRTYQNIKMMYEGEKIPEGYIVASVIIEETRLDRNLVKSIIEKYQRSWKQAKAKQDKGENVEGWIDDLIDEICGKQQENNI